MAKGRGERKIRTEENGKGKPVTTKRRVKAQKGKKGNIRKEGKREAKITCKIRPLMN